MVHEIKMGSRDPGGGGGGAEFKELWWVNLNK